MAISDAKVADPEWARLYMVIISMYRMVPPSDEEWSRLSKKDQKDLRKVHSDPLIRGSITELKRDLSESQLEMLKCLRHDGYVIVGRGEARFSWELILEVLHYKERNGR